MKNIVGELFSFKANLAIFIKGLLKKSQAPCSFCRLDLELLCHQTCAWAYAWGLNAIRGLGRDKPETTNLRQWQNVTQHGH